MYFNRETNHSPTLYHIGNEGMHQQKLVGPLYKRDCQIGQGMYEIGYTSLTELSVPGSL
jgi:hypothetical protein